MFILKIIIDNTWNIHIYLKCIIFFSNIINLLYKSKLKCFLNIIKIKNYKNHMKVTLLYILDTSLSITIVLDTYNFCRCINNLWINWVKWSFHFFYGCQRAYQKNYVLWLEGKQLNYKFQHPNIDFGWKITKLRVDSKLYKAINIYKSKDEILPGVLSKLIMKYVIIPNSIVWTAMYGTSIIPCQSY